MWVRGRGGGVAMSAITIDSTLFCHFSLLSHSAVVARELGLPTIVSVSGGLMKRLKVNHAFMKFWCHVMP